MNFGISMFCRCFAIQLTFLLFLCLSLRAQDKAETGFPDYPFLFRLQHTTESSNVCVLLRRDGGFHLEHTHGDDTEVSEGKISDDELQKLHQTLDTDQLRKLTQASIFSVLLESMSDGLQVNIFRGDHWQNLSFPDSTSQRPYRETLRSLVAWMNALHDLPHRSLSEDEGKNNCLTPGKIQLKVRTGPASPTPVPEIVNGSNGAATEVVQPSAGHPGSFLFRYSREKLANGRLENTCVIVYPAGKYRMEKRSGEIQFKIKPSVFEGTIPADQLLQLGKLLEAPQLKNERHKDNLPEGITIRSADFIWLGIPRSTGDQDLKFSNYSGRLANGSPANGVDDASSIGPLQEFLMESLIDKKLTPSKSKYFNNCVPEP